MKTKNKPEPTLTYPEGHVIFSSRWTVKDLMEAVQYTNDYSDDEVKSMLDDDKVEELAEAVNDAVQSAIEDFMNCHF
jgi:hypothetical protein